MCDKSPINIIQEYCVKRGIVPNYEIITKQGGTHNNIFACIATCGNYRGEATAPNKKEAKKLAADLLIDQIPELSSKNKKSVEILVDNKTLNADLGSVQQKQPNLVLNNYINFLQEWCVKKNIPSPEYKTINTGRFAHQPLFETECKILSYSSKGIGDTKKASKHEAAKNMYSELTGIQCPKMEEMNPIIDLDKLGIDIKTLELDTYPEEKVYEEYKKLYCNTRNVQAGDHKTIENCHNDLRDSYNERERKAVCKMLQDITSHSNSEGDKANIKKTFENILQRLNVTVTYRDLSSMIDSSKCEEKIYIASIALSTNPKLVEIFCCQTYASAQYQAVINLSKMLIQFLC